METENTHEEYKRQIAELGERIEALDAKYAPGIKALEVVTQDTPSVERMEALEARVDKHDERIDGVQNNVWPMPKKGQKWPKYLAGLWRFHEDRIRANNDIRQMERALERERVRARAEPATEDQIRKWADRRMFTALKEWGADADRATSIMDNMVDQDALMERIGDAVAEWAGELAGEYQPPAKPDPERIAEIAPGLTALPPPAAAEWLVRLGPGECKASFDGDDDGGYLAMGADCVFGTRSDPTHKDVVRFANHSEAEDAVKFWRRWNNLASAKEVQAPPLPPTEADAAKTLDEDCGPPADPRPPATLADEIAAKMNGAPRDDRLRDHWAVVAQAGIDMVKAGRKHDDVLLEMLNTTADRTALARRTPAMRAFNPNLDRVKECMAHVILAVAPDKGKYRFNSPKGQQLADDVLAAKAADAFREPPLGERYRPQDVALRMAQSLAKQADDPHPLEVANWMVVCERGLLAELAAGADAETAGALCAREEVMRKAIEERAKINPEMPPWKPSKEAFDMAFKAIPERAKQVKEDA